MPTPSRGLFWFRHDLRLHDQVALLALSEQVDTLLCVYLYPSAHQSKHLPDSLGDGKNRKRFHDETVIALNEALQEVGQTLCVLPGNETQKLQTICKDYGITHIGVTDYGGWNERQAVQVLAGSLPGVSLVTGESCTLFNQESLPFPIEAMPNGYTGFRKKIEKHCKVEAPLAPPVALPPPPDTLPQSKIPSRPASATDFKGGEQAGLDHLHRYFANTDAPATYKETRNAMDGWWPSTKFSPWLALGALSPRLIYKHLADFEQNVVSNDSTYWIYFELLWREFFHWLQRKHGTQFFAYAGFKDNIPDSHYNIEVIKRWCYGETGYDIVDACMRQLNATGYMSNRGRQLVASCLVHELNQDWRAGAAYFERQLIDYDVGSNWGNWLYLAGVGSDPRGHRKFNLKKQTDTYDPDGTFRNKWLKQ
ncbi:DASH family cryptochrome [Alteromonas sp. ASW11-19]|uniref:Cryptochrome DASH n=1 Tax=Alteromonas salexigens TaxID=2982530 RepID=A0ABT2VLG7_9ALTE|nr:DASH family cryptochrome [Alteromonas salexigens]MCU7554155.1 DASH family cryptochrome [Alteromonas salexigens]